MDPLLQLLENDGVDLDAPRKVEHQIVPMIPILGSLFKAGLVEELERQGCEVTVSIFGVQASEIISPNAAAERRTEWKRSVSASFIAMMAGARRYQSDRPKTNKFDRMHSATFAH